MMTVEGRGWGVGEGLREKSQVNRLKPRRTKCNENAFINDRATWNICQHVALSEGNDVGCRKNKKKKKKKLEATELP